MWNKKAGDPIMEALQPGDRVVVYFDVLDEGHHGVIENAEGKEKAMFARFKILLDEIDPSIQNVPGVQRDVFQFYPYSREHEGIMVVPEDETNTSPEKLAEVKAKQQADLESQISEPKEFRREVEQIPTSTSTTVSKPLYNFQYQWYQHPQTKDWYYFDPIAQKYYRAAGKKEKIRKLSSRV